MSHSVQANPRQSPHTLPGVLAIKGLKGVIIDHDAVARETKNYSKNVLDYARVESLAPGHDVADIQDVGDRLAFLTYKAGEVSITESMLLESAARRTILTSTNFDLCLSVCPLLFATMRHMTIMHPVNSSMLNMLSDSKLPVSHSKMSETMRILSTPTASDVINSSVKSASSVPPASQTPPRTRRLRHSKLSSMHLSLPILSYQRENWKLQV